MKYDFDTVLSRRGMESSKWNLMKRPSGFPVSQSVFPYSVADMEFAVAPEIRRELSRLVDFGIYGYHDITPSLFTSFTEWTSKRHGWNTSETWMTMTPGVVPALNVAVRAFTSPGDGVIIMPPVYPPFYRAVSANGRRPELCPLVCSAGQDGGLRYELNFDRIESAAKKDDVKLCILCSPHNPVSRVWKAEELERLADICARHGVLVVSDEIHCDLLFNGARHVPFGSPSFGGTGRAGWIVCMAPSKTFNLAGLSSAVTIVEDTGLRDTFRKQYAVDCGEYVNLFGMTAFRAAYAYGGPWLDALLTYLDGNSRVLRSFFAERFPEVPFAPLEGSYLMWCDMSPLGMDWKELETFMSDKAEFFADEGYIFGTEGRGYERINIACPRSILLEGLERLAKAAGR